MKHALTIQHWVPEGSQPHCYECQQVSLEAFAHQDVHTRVQQLPLVAVGQVMGVGLQKLKELQTQARK